MILEQEAVLSTFAEVAATISGFAGIAVVLRRATGADRTSDDNALIHLLLSTLGVTALAMIPLMAQSVFTDPATLWRVCAPLLGALHLFGALRGTRDVGRSSLAVPPWLVVPFAAASAGIFAASVAIAAGALGALAPSLYLAGLFLSLVIAVTVVLPMLLRQDA